MKRIGLISILLVLITICVNSQEQIISLNTEKTNKQNSNTSANFFLDENGVTIKCENCVPGDTGTVNEILYEAVDRALLDQRRDEGTDLSKVCTSLVTEMDSLFFLIDFNQDISTWDVSNVTDMSSMFFNANSFNQNISSWDVSSVMDMSSMFRRADEFNQDIGSWDVSNVSYMEGMFAGDYYVFTSFNQDIGDWDVSNVSDMSGMFDCNESFNQDIGSWDVSNVTDMSFMFCQASNFNRDIGAWDVSNVTNLMFMFLGTIFNQDIGAWDVSNVTNMANMFSGVRLFNQNIGSWNVSNVTNMNYMFNEAYLFNQDLSGWCVENISTEPESFTTGCPLQTDFYPKWGTCPSAVNINDIDILGLFNIYPNPISSTLNIETGNSNHYSIEIISLNGKLMLSSKVEGSTNQLDLSSFQSGVYFITIRSKDYVTTRKIVKL